MKRARLLLGDAYTLLLEAFKNLLEPEFEVVATVTDGRTLLQKAKQLKPDLVLLDISMPLLNGLDDGRLLTSILPNVKLIYLTGNHDLDFVTKDLQNEALGYVLKTSSAAELREAIRLGLRGVPISPPRSAAMNRSFMALKTYGRTQKNSMTLTSRQREVLQLLAEGLSMKEAAHILSISKRTIAFHKYGMMRDFDIHSNAELFKFAVRQRVVNIERNRGNWSTDYRKVAVMALQHKGSPALEA